MAHALDSTLSSWEEYRENNLMSALELITTYDILLGLDGCVLTYRLLTKANATRPCQHAVGSQQVVKTASLSFSPLLGVTSPHDTCPFLCLDTKFFVVITTTPQTRPNILSGPWPR